MEHYVKLDEEYSQLGPNCDSVKTTGSVNSEFECPEACGYHFYNGDLKYSIITYDSVTDECNCYDDDACTYTNVYNDDDLSIFVSKNLYHDRLPDFLPDYPEALWLNIAPQELIWYNKDVISNGTSINNKTIVKNIGDIINFVLNTTGTETIHLLDSACPQNIHTTHKNKSLLYPISTKTAEYSFMIIGKYGNIYISEHNSYCIYNLNDYFNMHFTIRF